MNYFLKKMFNRYKKDKTYIALIKLNKLLIKNIAIYLYLGNI